MFVWSAALTGAIFEAFFLLMVMVCVCYNGALCGFI